MFIIISLVFFYLTELLSSGFLQFKCNFVRGQNNSKYRDWALLKLWIVMDLLVTSDFSSLISPRSLSIQWACLKFFFTVLSSPQTPTITLPGFLSALSWTVDKQFEDRDNLKNDDWQLSICSEISTCKKWNTVQHGQSYAFKADFNGCYDSWWPIPSLIHVCRESW